MVRAAIAIALIALAIIPAQGADSEAPVAPAPAPAAPAPVPAASAPADPGPLRIVTISGKSELVNYWYSLNDECVSVGYSDVQIVTPPSHGTLAVEKGEAKPKYPQSSPRFRCNDRNAPVVVVRYASEPGFSGIDEFEIRTAYPTGNTRDYKYRVTVWDTAPKRVSGGKLEYPWSARKVGVEGEVLVWLYVDVEGRVTKVSIRKSPHEVLSDAATRALREWRFEVPTIAGKPTGFTGEYSIVFRLSDPDPEVEQL